jgi:hypothetical protein
LTTSANLITWTPPVATSVHASSIDVKYDAVHERFVMFDILDFSCPQARLALRTSRDGIHWTEPQVICGRGCFPPWAHNVGVSGDDQGHLLGSGTLVGYGAPYGLNPAYQNDCAVSPGNCWGRWDLYGQFVDLAPPPVGPAP